MSTENIPSNKRTTCPWTVDPAIQTSIDRAIESDPSRYKLAQNFGDFIMETPFANVDTFKVATDDIRGDKIRATNIINTIKQYGLSIQDLNEDEKIILNKVLGSDWTEILNISLE